MAMLRLLLFVLGLCLVGCQPQFRKKQVPPVPTQELNLFDPVSMTIQKGNAVRFCHEPISFLIMFREVYKTMFTDLVIEVVSTSEGGLRTFSVQGKSTDDFYNHLSQVAKHFTAGSINASYLSPLAMPTSDSSLLRDFLSSCPLPFSLNTHLCTMRFSSVGKACVTVRADHSDLEIVVDAQEQYNTRYALLLALSIAVLSYANHVSESKLLQYSAGAVLGVTAGPPMLLCLLLCKILWHTAGLVPAITNFFHDHETLVEILAPLILVVSSVLSVGLVAYLMSSKSRLQWWMDHWLYVAAYILVASMVGMSCILYFRRDADRLHALTVSVRWFFRVVGVTLLYQSFSSPLHSLCALGVAIICYLLCWLIKRLFPGTRKSDARNAKAKTD